MASCVISSDYQCLTLSNPSYQFERMQKLVHMHVHFDTTEEPPTLATMLTLESTTATYSSMQRVVHLWSFHLKCIGSICDSLCAGIVYNHGNPGLRSCACMHAGPVILVDSRRAVERPITWNRLRVFLLYFWCNRGMMQPYIHCEPFQQAELHAFECFEQQSFSDCHLFRQCHSMIKTNELFFREIRHNSRIILHYIINA